jgi:hypothetical protein
MTSLLRNVFLLLFNKKFNLFFCLVSLFSSVLPRVRLTTWDVFAELKKFVQHITQHNTTTQHNIRGSQDTCPTCAHSRARASMQLLCNRATARTRLKQPALEYVKKKKEKKKLHACCVTKMDRFYNCDDYF